MPIHGWSPVGDSLGADRKWVPTLHPTRSVVIPGRKLVTRSLVVSGGESVVGTERMPYEGDAGAVGEVVAGWGVEDGQVRWAFWGKLADVGSA